MPLYIAFIVAAQMFVVLSESNNCTLLHECLHNIKPKLINPTSVLQDIEYLSDEYCKKLDEDTNCLTKTTDCKKDNPIVVKVLVSLSTYFHTYCINESAQWHLNKDIACLMKHQTITMNCAPTDESPEYENVKNFNVSEAEKKKHCQHEKEQMKCVLSASEISCEKSAKERMEDILNPWKTLVTEQCAPYYPTQSAHSYSNGHRIVSYYLVIMTIFVALLFHS